jgi:hypothetical protein
MLGDASPFPPFLSLIHILPICFDSAQVLYIYRVIRGILLNLCLVVSSMHPQIACMTRMIIKKL